MPDHQRLTEHYHQGLRDDAILTQVRTHYPHGPTLHQLAPLDQLHIGGIAASKKLLNLLDPKEHPKVLDIGSGLGGLMRQGAALGLQITGLDITHRFNALNQTLSQLTLEPHSLDQSGASLRYITGNASALPFAENTFDAVLFQHSLMNMPDPNRVIAQCRRVLRPGGRLVMHEVVSGENITELRFPVPWAATQEHSHLLTMTELTQLLEANGFQLLHSEDWSSTALEWRQRQRQKEQASHAAVLSPQWVFGERFLKMGKNLLENLSIRAINVVEISARC
ncbi:MAG: methyltransferase domain-containing protein [Halomonas sp.]|nr:methyltransferase domain-containing protein [Halomonas sp.]MCC5903355.1 methyltransferase domain-containing protein [Halomonas sp.]